METAPRQCDRLMQWVRACWRLRNLLVEDRYRDRRDNRVLKQQGIGEIHYLNLSDQYLAIHEYVQQDSELCKVHSQVRQNVAVRVDEGYKRFFDALKEGKTAVHAPQYVEFKKYRSITYPQYGSAAHIKDSTLYLSGLGAFRLFDYRKIKGGKKTVTVKFKQGRWHCIVTAEVQEKDVIEMPGADDQRWDAGLDTGLTKLMTDSHGREYDPPKAWYDYRCRLKEAQKKLSRQFEARKKAQGELVKQAKAENRRAPSLKDMPYSNRLKAQVKRVAIIHTKIERIRDYHHKKNASVISDLYRYAAVEEHGVQFMIRNRKLAKVASDRAIHKQKLLLQSRIGKRYIEAPNKREDMGGNSQSCTCGASVPKELKDRVHICPFCGLVGRRDHVSANIVSIIAFGYASITLGSVAGQAVVRRGEGKAQSSESGLCESRSREASESSVKRQPPVQERSTTGGEPTVGDKTRGHDRVRPVLPRESEAVRYG